jgi:hypothetical protein
MIKPTATLFTFSILLQPEDSLLPFFPEFGKIHSNDCGSGFR